MADQQLATCVRIFRNCCPGGPESQKFLVADPDVLVENYEELCLELLQLKKKIHVAFLSNVIGKAFPRLTSGECTAWAQRINAALKHILVKRKQSTSGKKLNAAVWRIIQELGAESPAPIASSSSSSSRPMPVLPSSSSKELFPSDMDPLLSAQAIKAQAKKSLGDFEEDDLPEESASVHSVSSSSSVAQNFQQYFDSASMCMVRLFPSGQLAQSIMQPGKNGFAVAIFPPDTKEIPTELPNSLLQSFQEKSGTKKKPAAQVRVNKRPAASSSSVPASRARTEAAPVEADPFKPAFEIMYYKEPKHSWAIRQKGGKQLFQITCQHRPKENLRDMMLQAVKKLEAGQSAEQVKEWCRSQRESI